MKRFMQDLGDLAGLDIAGMPSLAPVRTGADAATSLGDLSRDALRWLGRASGGDGRCRADDERCPAASRASPAPLPH